MGDDTMICGTWDGFTVILRLQRCCDMLRSGRYMDGVPTLLVRYWCIMPEYLVARSFF